MLKNFEKQLLIDTINTFGKTAQLQQTQEELAELMQAISHYMRNKFNCLNDVYEEVADVQIMIAQLYIILPDAENKINEKIKEKLDRLRKIINDYNNSSEIERERYS